MRRVLALAAFVLAAAPGVAASASAQSAISRLIELPPRSVYPYYAGPGREVP